ncbi:MAG TPA: coenzyme F420-0:L-glutamate ligase [Candidatus Dormibacteraeota bacterium]|jgi:coenzyme F420-0:L-glutamate ligase/coenzyme F420-1:gamma-L-glutamate ligase|nr:coenzyme F420-0:L-glutamate ligase [Candidatus Dormibacteraeota bacterium]
MTVEIIPVKVDVEIGAADDLARLVLESAPPLQDGDVIVVTHKAVSKSEGRVVDLDTVAPSARAHTLAGSHSDPRLVELILRESRDVLRQRGPLFVVETAHGLVCANAGIDRSNAPRPGAVVLLPRDPDASAQALRARLEAATSRRLAVIVADTMGRAWREGIVGTAIGASGLTPLLELFGQVDPNGYVLASTAIAVADELAAAADLVLGKLERVPTAIIRGYPIAGEGSAQTLIRERAQDLFR